MAAILDLDRNKSGKVTTTSAVQYRSCVSQTKDYKISICCFPSNHKNNDWYLSSLCTNWSFRKSQIPYWVARGAIIHYYSHDPYQNT